MTVLFSDVRSFTTISEGLSPTELTAMMNDYLTQMTESIRPRAAPSINTSAMRSWLSGGRRWRAKHPENALTAAIQMQKRLKEMGLTAYVKRGWPKLEIGVGLNCGTMNVGDMGSSSAALIR